jgi:hypothetical protein
MSQQNTHKSSAEVRAQLEAQKRLQEEQEERR